MTEVTAQWKLYLKSCFRRFNCRKFAFESKIVLIRKFIKSFILLTSQYILTLDVKFSGTVDLGAKVTKFDAFSQPEFGVFMQCHAVFV